LTAVPAISPARKAAFDILLALERDLARKNPRGPHADALLNSKTNKKLSPADRHLATTLVLGVLRWQILLDAELKRLLTKTKKQLDPEVSIALRMGAFQLRFLDRIPAHAAIDESVELTKQSGHRFASGLVNAVLRKFAAANPAADLPQETAGELAVAHPAWLVERWTQFYGLDAARAICHHGQTQPARTIRLANPVVETELTAAGVTLEPTNLLTAARTVTSGDIVATAAYREGRVRIQDEGSQLIAELAAVSGNPLDQKVKSIPIAKSILDTCAAPGGKTLILAERHPEAHILACESSPPRLAELRERLSAHAARIECRLADATALTENSVFDLVLADVPCSGTGTLGRNPEIRHRLRPEDLARHAERQRAILSAGLCAVRPGGRVLYSTCSLEPEENEHVVAAVLAENQNARQISLEAPIAALSDAGILTAPAPARLGNCLTPEGALCLLPSSLSTDGFFVALLERMA
jgi:16S rRNA (cytosine967-C5)-methyltransferase